MEKITLIVKEENVVFISDSMKSEYKRYKGFEQIAELLARPEKEISCRLLATNDLAFRMARAKIYYGSEDVPIDSFDSLSSFEKDEIRDEKCFNDKKKEAISLIAQIAVTEEYNDLYKLKTLKDELAEVVEHLMKMTKSDGKSQTFPDGYSVSKDAVRKNIRKAIKLVKEKNPELAEHLRKQIRIGKYCCYHSLPSVEITIIKTCTALERPIS